MTIVRRLRDTAQVAALAAIERTVPRWPAAWITAAQNRRLRAIVQHAYATVPFYRRVMDERGLTPAAFRTVADLERLPLIDGDDLQRDPTAFLSTAYDDSRRQLRYTSGGHSGVVKHIYWEHDLMLRKLAYAERDRPILNRLIGRGWGQRQLYILPATSIDLVLRAMWERRYVVPPGLARREVIEHLSPLAEIVARIDAARPDVIFSYGSFADVFVRSLLERGLTVPAPRLWVYGGDSLSAPGRALIEQHLGCRVYTTYQAIETGRIAFQCERRDGFHLNTDLVALRLIDEAGRAVPPGEPGEVVISNLHMRATVLLNYRLGDRAVLGDQPCACGRTLPLMTTLEGRVSDVLVRPDGHKVSAYAVKANCKSFLKARAAQLVNDGPGRARFIVVPMAGTDREALRQELVADVQRMTGPDMAVTVDFVTDVSMPASGKLPQVVTADSVAARMITP